MVHGWTFGVWQSYSSAQGISLFHHPPPRGAAWSVRHCLTYQGWKTTCTQEPNNADYFDETCRMITHSTNYVKLTNKLLSTVCVCSSLGHLSYDPSIFVCVIFFLILQGSCHRSVKTISPQPVHLPLRAASPPAEEVLPWELAGGEEQPSVKAECIGW